MFGCGTHSIAECSEGDQPFLEGASMKGPTPSNTVLHVSAVREAKDLHGKPAVVLLLALRILQ